MGPIGMQEMIGLFVIALLLFGPKKLPELGRTLGKALTEFRRAKNELKNTFEAHMNELEKETRVEPAKTFTPTTYSYPYDDYGRYEEPVPEVAASIPSHQLESGASTGIPDSSTASGSIKELKSEAAASAEQASFSQNGVAGTVARSNGIQPRTAIADQEHPS